ncbi:hypothetical protein ACFVZH_08105 [Streptomyces sp. NPDC059534]|uniref:hypothetical protein n=1 Tax=Streptomyces sp. NPDC059534 TaxID=3346859 RepID=UPI0036BE1B5B
MMSVSLRKDIHHWTYFEEDCLSFCQFCGTILDKGHSPASDTCTFLHDEKCVCIICETVRNG